LGWVNKHLWAGIVGAAVVGTGTAWVRGFITPWVPPPEDARCWIEETWNRHINGPVPRDPERFTVLVARLQGDSDGSQTRFVRDAFLNQRGFRRLATCRVVAIEGEDETAAEEAAKARAQILLLDRGGDLVIWGKVVRPNAMRLWFTPRMSKTDLSSRPWVLDKETGALPSEFHAAFADALLATTAAQVYAANRPGQFVADLLGPLLPRVRSLLADLPAALNGDQRGTLLFAAGWALTTYGAQAGDKAALRDAVSAFSTALDEFRRDRVPLDWAHTQTERAQALLRLAEQGDDRAAAQAAAEQSVAALRAALEVLGRNDHPIDWARTQTILGNALLVLGERGDTAALDQAADAQRAAREMYPRESEPLVWAGITYNLGRVLAARGRLGEDAALREAVATFRAALEEQARWRDDAPMDWANSQLALCDALAALGQRGDDAALRDAVACFRDALEEFERLAHGPDAQLARGNLERAERLLRERGG
jgi:tetratricopeptide (TPR) repeat protein